MMSNRVEINLVKSAGFRGSYKVIHVIDKAIGTLEISLRRTVRVPENWKSYDLPPNCESFPLYSIAEHEAKLGKNVVEKGGAHIS